MDENWHEKEQLIWAVEENDLPRVKELLAQGCDINFMSDDLYWTPLHMAVKEEHFEMAKLLIEQGANVNMYNAEKIGETPLGLVASNCSYEMAKLLVDAGADPTIEGWMRLTALPHAEKRKKPEGVRVYELLEAAAKKFKKA